MDWFGDTFFIISIHAPLAGRDGSGKVVYHPQVRISIHAPLAGRDDNNGNNESTTGAISIHAPLAGRDKWSAAFSLST